MKKRRRRKKYRNWTEEIINGNKVAFYKSTDFDIAREKVLVRDKHTCQWFLGKWQIPTHKPKYLKVVRANTVHHIIPIAERPDLALDLENLISLSFEAHEIIENRQVFHFKKKKIPLTKEKW